ALQPAPPLRRLPARRQGSAAQPGQAHVALHARDQLAGRRRRRHGHRRPLGRAPRHHARPALQRSDGVVLRDDAVGLRGGVRLGGPARGRQPVDRAAPRSRHPLGPQAPGGGGAARQRAARGPVAARRLGPMGEFGIGQPVKRFEDVRLLTGRGRYQGDVNLPGQVHMVVLRSPHPHARIRGIDARAALAAPGIVAVLTGAELAKDKLGTMRMTLKRKRPDGSPMFTSPHLGVSPERVRYIGDPVGLVIAETLAQAKDAAELVDVDYEPLPAVTGTADAVKPGAPPVWDEGPDNISRVYGAGKKAAADAAMASAVRIVRRRFDITRVHAQYMEPRGALGVWDPGEERYTLYADGQYPHRVRTAPANNIFKAPEHRLRGIAGEVGGGFGTKGWQYPEHRLVLWAAKKIRRPVKWACERRQAIPADEHAGDNVTEAERAP